MEPRKGAQEYVNQTHSRAFGHGVLWFRLLYCVVLRFANTTPRSMRQEGGGGTVGIGDGVVVVVGGVSGGGCLCKIRAPLTPRPADSFLILLSAISVATTE